jgi:hypothetical protein
LVPYEDSGVELESAFDPGSLIYAVDSIPDSILAPWLAFEALFPVAWDSGILYRRIDDTLSPIASVNENQPPEISDSESLLATAKQSGIVEIPGFEKPKQLISLGVDYYLVLPTKPPLPQSLADSLTKVVSHVRSIGLSSLAPLDYWDDSKIDELIEFNHGLVYSSVCLFMIDASGIIEWAHSVSPHALNISITHHAGRFFTKMMGNSGFSYVFSQTRYLCVFFCRTQSDPELLATQTVNAMKRGLGLPDSVTLIPGSHLALSASGHETKTRIQSFIDAQ